MLQQTEPDDFVLATGELHGLRDLVTLAAQAADFNLE
jgi:GDP-D-mannose dehydratase